MPCAALLLNSKDHISISAADREDVGIKASQVGAVAMLRTALGKSVPDRDFTLEDMLKDLDVAQAKPAEIDALLGTKRGLLQHDGQDFITMGVTYHPPGWTVHRDWDFGGSVEGALTLAEALKGWPGFDQAGWAEYVHSKLEDYLSVEMKKPSWSALADVVSEALKDDPDLIEELAGVKERLLALGEIETNSTSHTPKKSRAKKPSR